MTRSELWKLFCLEANPLMEESLAVGYQLQKHYHDTHQRYLLPVLLDRMRYLLF